MNKKIIAFLILFYLLSYNKASVAENKSIKSIDITSATFEMLVKDSVMTFNKMVVIKSVNFDAQCDKAIVYLEKGKVKKIIMSGNVKIQKDNSQINGSNVIFELETEKIIVEGNVKTKIKFSN